MCVVGVCPKVKKKAVTNEENERQDYSGQKIICIGVSKSGNTSKFNLFSSDSSCLVQRQSHEEFHPDCIQRTVKFPASVMLWGCFSWFGIGRLHICENTDQKQYLNILEN